MILTRRQLVIGGAGLVSGCDAIGNSAPGQALLGLGEATSFRVQRALTDRMALAREFRPDQMSPRFRANGTVLPEGADYARHAAAAFADWRLGIDGLVARPLALSLAQVRTMPARTQITRHDCVEGWSAIGKWTGVPLKLLLDMAGLSGRARFIVFHCADTLGRNGARYYESIDLVDAFHPQTIIAWGMNDALLTVAHGAPLRLRVERQLGYKHAKYVERIEAVATLDRTGGGKGGFWEDRGYEWYAGI